MIAEGKYFCSPPTPVDPPHSSALNRFEGQAVSGPLKEVVTWVPQALARGTPIANHICCWSDD